MATDWGALIREWGPVALEAYSAYSGNRASERATDAQLDALGQAGDLQYRTALQAMELARQRDMQTRLDTEQARFGGYNAMNVIARQLGLPVYNQPFNRTLDTFTPGGGIGGLGGSGARVTGPSAPAGVFPGFRQGPSNEQEARMAGAKYGGAAGTAIGSYFGGPAGGAVGNLIGEYIGKKAAPEIERRGNLIGPLTAGLKIVPGPVGGLVDKFLGDGGDLATGSRVYAMSNGTFFDQNGDVIARVQKPTSGMVQVPGLSRNGNPIFLTAEGNIVKQQQSGGGFDDLGFNINDATDGPREINKIIAKGYTPAAPNQADYDAFNAATGGVGIPTGETQNTGLIQEPTTLDRYAGFKETPGYQFVLDEGLRARDKMAASRGRYFSGGTGRELERYAQGVASQEYDNYFRRLQDQVTGGNSATQVTTNVGTGATDSSIRSLLGGASDLGNTILGAGQVRGSGIVTNNQNTNAAISGIAGSGIFDRLGSIFGSGGGKTTGVTKAGSGGSGYIYNDPFNNPYYGGKP